MEHRDDAILCQHLLRAGVVGVKVLGACADEQRQARQAGLPVPRLADQLLARGVISAAELDEAGRTASGRTPTRRRRRLGTSSSRWSTLGGAGGEGVSQGDRLGTWELLDQIARGSAGQVFRARCIRSGEQAAVKVLAAERQADETATSRFIKESRLACRLDHPALVRGRTFGIEGGVRYLVMEHFPAPTLRSLMQDGALAPTRVARIGVQVAWALSYLHGEGVVHRDVKPANILVSPETAKLCDLGLAREVGIHSAATASGATLGTPRYMAPEQARGSRDIGPGADLYALGVTLFHAVAGQPPFPEESGIVALSRHLFDEVPDVRRARPDVPEALALVLWRLTRKDPRERFVSAAEVAVALQDLRVRGEEEEEALRRVA